MDFMEVFFEYLNNEIPLSSAELRIEKMLPELMSKGNIKEYEKAVLCLTYFKRYQQYNSGQISGKDLLLFLRDFVLYMGRFHFPKLIVDVVERNGAELGVLVAADGAVDVAEKYPACIAERKQFVRQVYSLGEDLPVGDSCAITDGLVKSYTQFSAYRSLEQKIAVHSAINLPNDHTLMISLPTGGGKSLITQLLAASEPRLTLVVVPTVSLAKDQSIQAKKCLIDETTKKGIYCYSSDTNNDEALRSIKDKTARLIITSPEAIMKSIRLNKALKGAAEDGYLHNVVIDEAHIVPDWGVNFRPEFQIFSVVLNEWRAISERSIRTYLLSATLSDDVVEVLFNLFGSGKNNVQFRCDALRKEPRFMVTENHNYDSRANEVIEMVKYLPKPLIVYVIEPSVAQKYCKTLNKQGYSNIYSYTGETSDQDRERLLESWKNNEFDVMFATSAFGMGVDKGNVRTIIHSCVPENLSRFYQEVGRAGRDGLPSLSIMDFFVSKDDGRNDLSVAFGLVNKSILKTENLIIRLESILESAIIDGDIVTADLSTVPHSFSADEAEHAGQRNMCWNANTLLLLHRQGYISITEAKYDADNRTYFFSFRILDDDLIRNSEKLSQAISSDRQKEYDMRVAGYHKMADIIHKPTAKCWAKHFASLYPYAQAICNGCPVHPEGTNVKEDNIRIRDKSIVKVEPGEPTRLIRRYMGALNDLLIPVDDYREIDIQEVVEKSNKLGLSCIVFPQKYGAVNTQGCLGLTSNEFISIADKVSWLFKNGIFVLLDDDIVMSNKVFETLDKEPFVKYRKVWCCKSSTRINSRNRTVNEFLNCHSCDLSNL